MPGYYLRLCFLWLLPGLWAGAISAQAPANDNCANAEVLSISNGGFGYGVFSSDTIPLNNATTQLGEFFPSNSGGGVPNGKSVWYRFSIPTTREVIVVLGRTDTTTLPDRAGWALYRANGCLPGATEVIEPFFNRYEGYTHACLRRGEYLLQVGGILSNNDSIFVVLETSPASAPEIDHDHAAQAHDFQILGGSVLTTNYEIGCQSFFPGELLCPDSTYSKTSWHVFTTDNHIDALEIRLRESPFDINTPPPRNFAIQLYEGDIRLDSTGLPLVDSCAQLLQDRSSSFTGKLYPCELKPNTTYSIQVSFPTDYFGRLQVQLEEVGTQPTAGPNPASLPVTHQLGTLSSATAKITDAMACNARMSLYNCPPIIQDTININNVDYDLNWWLTFDLPIQADVNFQSLLNQSQPNLYLRVFRGSAADSCNLQQAAGFIITSQTTNIPCLEAGTYSVQVLGQSLHDRLPGYSNLGRTSRLNLTLGQTSVNRFGLFSSTEIDSINLLNPLTPGIRYNSTPMPLDCRTTVMPGGDSCHFAYSGYNFNDRALYRIIEVADNGVLAVGGGVWPHFRYKLFRGDARTAPVVNDTLQGLQDLTCCQSTYFPFKVCVSPGTYTLVTFADITDINRLDAPWVQLDTFPQTRFTNPNAPEVLDTLRIGNTIITTPTYFTCDLNNPLTILGNAPCGGSTKQVYREVYFADSISLYLLDQTTRHFYGGGVLHRIFAGRLSTNSLTGMLRDCGGTYRMLSCDFIAPGWYTIVSYHQGGTYANPNICGNTGQGIGDETGFSLTPNVPYNIPQFNELLTAEQVNNGQPISWIFHNDHTDTIPHTDTTWTLTREFFNCENDLPFPAGINPCTISENRVVYRVFTLAKAAHVRIGTALNSRLYQGDITAATPPFTIVQDCFNGAMRQCLPPGTYTLISFASDSWIGRSDQPTIYLDSLMDSRYDHARSAYNFGLIPRDSVEYRAAAGAPVDLYGRPASNDFITCTTTAHSTDPVDGCRVGSSSLPYSTPNPTNPRQNLWYTFEVSGPGNIDISVYPLTPGKVGRLPFNIYKVTNNVYPLIDSTTARLSFVATSTLPRTNCQNLQTVRIFRDPCTGITTDRYVIIVDRNAYYNAVYSSYWPNMQVQVGVRFQNIPGTTVQYDHYSTANVISGSPTTICNPPYSAISLRNGTFEGCEGNLTCATYDNTDQNACGLKTIWYKFEVEGSGRMRVQHRRTDIASNNIDYDADDMMLFRQVVPGDSTAAGLEELPLARVWQQNPLDPGRLYWGQTCYTAGTYYLMVTGCNFPNATVVPRVWMENFPGDYCQDSIQLSITAPGTYETFGIVDCWTIGEGPGEIDSVGMGCLGNPETLKSGWFHITVDTATKMDLDISLRERTTANALQVNYRVGNGSCNSMNFSNCVDDGAFITLNLKCRRDSGLWIQVVMPQNALDSVYLQVTATPSPDQNCEPGDPFAPSAAFDFLPGCVGDPITFINQSTVGNSLQYLWDFGDGFTSVLPSPIHTYNTVDTFLVGLVVSNNDGKADTSQRLIFIYPKPQTGFTHTTPVIAGQPVTFTNTTTSTLTSATYYWNFCAAGGFCSADIKTYAGANPPSVTFNVPGTYVVCLEVTNGNCDSIFCETIIVESIDFFSGGPYDGASLGRYEDCDTINFFSGGPYDGADKSRYEDCDTIAFFTGGPYDGSHMALAPKSCPDTMVSPYSGGPYDGASEASKLLNCPDLSVWAGGPNDGAAEALLEARCDTLNFFSGGPYDGADAGRYEDCDTVNFFSGGPYDGASLGRYEDCDTLNFFSGGPYDGTDSDFSGSLTVYHDQVCVGEMAELSVSTATDWYQVPQGGVAILTQATNYQIPSLQQTQIVYADEVCASTGRVPVVARVVDTLVPSFSSSANCPGVSSFFSSQTQVPGTSIPTIGVHITQLGATGTTPAPGAMTFSHATSSNITYLTDGLNNRTAWNSGTGQTTSWLQWQYRQPRAVDRIEFWNRSIAANNIPTQMRLYYSDNGPWVMVDVWGGDSIASGVVDTGPFCTTQGHDARRWKLEVDYPTGGNMNWGEFQAYANQPVTGGNAVWDFNDGSPQVSGTNIIHVFADSGWHDITLMVDGPCGCPGTVTQQVYVPFCIVLPAMEQALSGRLDDANVAQLDWDIQGEWEFATLERLVNGRWTRVADKRHDESASHRFSDELTWGMSSVSYRMRTISGGNTVLSNIVHLYPDWESGEPVLYPNPSEDEFTYLRVFLTEKSKLTYYVIDMSGKTLRSESLSKPRGQHEIPVNIAKLAQGTYMIRLWIGDEVKVLRLVKL
ncbi:MAG: PKD domain-containing protein [Bacteroidia bacterium]